MPDFFTLYLVVLLLGLSHAVLWAAIVYRYPDLKGARFWLCGAITPIFGGAVLATQGNDGLLVQTVVGNAFTIGGFYLCLMGVRRFHGDPTRWRSCCALLAVSIVAMVATFRAWYGFNPLYTFLQALPLLLTAGYLLNHRHRDLGAVIASIGLILAALMHLAMAGLFTVRLAGGEIEIPVARLAAADLLVLMFSATIWNFGFIVLGVDRLRSELVRLAAEDDLTGLPNRRSFLQRLDAALAGGEAPLSLLLFDLDRFKAINDGYGHAAGDAALSHVARTFHGYAASGGATTFARLGGDEFVILLPGAAADEATRTAEHIGALLRANPLAWKGDALPLSLSIGIACKAPGHALEAGGLIELADKALYHSKRKGKDTYTLLSSLPSRGPSPRDDRERPMLVPRLGEIRPRGA
ncbi:GGDEF domain-containing protein [Bosea sp. (in: a-proteobacteria)]